MSRQVSPSDLDLERFVEAQDPLYADVTAELRAGRKRSHWMWFIFPQVEGLGHSAMAQRYAIHSRVEATSYLAHPLLAARLIECTSLVLKHSNKSANEIFGSPDDLKFRSCMTLFDTFSGEDALFGRALDQFYNGQPDPATLAILKGWN